MKICLGNDKSLTAISATDPVPECKSIIRINTKLFYKLFIRNLYIKKKKRFTYKREWTNYMIRKELPESNPDGL